MSPSLLSSLSNLFNSIAAIVVSLFYSVLAVFQAIFALGTNIIESAFALVNQVVMMIVELFQGVFGFVAANIVAIGVVGVGYYIYQERRQRRGAVKL